MGPLKHFLWLVVATTSLILVSGCGSTIETAPPAASSALPTTLAGTPIDGTGAMPTNFTFYSSIPIELVTAGVAEMYVGGNLDGYLEWTIPIQDCVPIDLLDVVEIYWWEGNESEPLAGEEVFHASEIENIKIFTLTEELDEEGETTGFLMRLDFNTTKLGDRSFRMRTIIHETSCFDVVIEGDEEAVQEQFDLVGRFD
jgi:hypothetical protein